MFCNYNQISISFWRTAFWREVLLGSAHILSVVFARKCHICCDLLLFPHETQIEFCCVGFTGHVEVFLCGVVSTDTLL